MAARKELASLAAMDSRPRRSGAAAAAAAPEGALSSPGGEPAAAAPAAAATLAPADPVSTTSRFRGVSWYKTSRKWRAEIRHSGKKV